METIALGRAAVDDADCVLETGGRHLAHRVALGDGEVRTAAALMDGDGAYQTLLRTGDNPGGWQMIRKLIAALETHGITSLARPIKAWDGFDEAKGFVIG
jgi:hypothetical protein